MHLKSRSPALFLASLLCAGCPPPELPTKQEVSVRMAAIDAPSDAMVQVDDLLIGTLETVSKRGFRVLAGKHHISVTSPEYFAYDVVIDAVNETIFLKVDMPAIPK